MAKSMGASQGDSWPMDKGKGKEAKLLSKAKGLKVASKAKDDAPKAKKVDPKSKDADPKAIEPLVLKLGNKEDPPAPTKA